MSQAKVNEVFNMTWSNYIFLLLSLISCTFSASFTLTSVHSAKLLTFKLQHFEPPKAYTYNIQYTR